MSTFEEAKNALNRGKGKGSHRTRSDGQNIHLCWCVDCEMYCAYTFERDTFTEEDFKATDWVIE